jgi:large subunit ribosomal protein L20
MRATNGSATRQRRNRILKRAKGFRGGRGRLYRTAKEVTMRADVFAFAGRRAKKRDFRRLWITRITAAVRARGMMYSRFICGVGRAGIALNRKELSELAIHDPAAFDQICAKAKAAFAG